MAGRVAHKVVWHLQTIFGSYAYAYAETALEVNPTVRAATIFLAAMVAKCQELYLEKGFWPLSRTSQDGTCLRWQLKRDRVFQEPDAV
jgi:hypothetical protein